MLSTLIRAVIIAIVVTLGCVLIGAILVTIKVDIAQTIGNLKVHSAAIGVLVGLWYFFTGGQRLGF